MLEADSVEGAVSTECIDVVDTDEFSGSVARCVTCPAGPCPPPVVEPTSALPGLAWCAAPAGEEETALR